MSYLVCVMVHIKYPLVLIETKIVAQVVAAAGFLSLSERSFTICLTPCVVK